jgi:hypothetical protein
MAAITRWVSWAGKVVQLIVIAFGVWLFVVHLTRDPIVTRLFESLGSTGQAIFASGYVAYSIDSRYWTLSPMDERGYVGQFLSLTWLLFGVFAASGVPSVVLQSAARLSSKNAPPRELLLVTLLNRSFITPMSFHYYFLDDRVNKSTDRKTVSEGDRSSDFIAYTFTQDFGTQMFSITDRFWQNYSIRLGLALLVYWACLGSYKADFVPAIATSLVFYWISIPFAVLAITTYLMSVIYLCLKELRRGQ